MFEWYSDNLAFGDSRNVAASEMESGSTSLIRNRSGNIGVTFVALFAVVTAAAATGIETARLATNRTFVQDVSDSAALYGASLVSDRSLSDGEIVDKVKVWVLAQLTGGNVRLDKDGVIVTVDRARGAIRVETRAEHDLFIPFLKIEPVSLSAVTEAGAVEASNSGPGLCGLALDGSGQKAMHFKGDGAMAADDCVFWSNSRDKEATHGFGDGVAQTEQVCSVGKYSKAGAYSVAPPPEDNCAPLNDPYAAWKAPAPAWAACDFVDFTVNGGGYNVTLDPGVYCGGLDVGNARNVTLGPGRYFIDGKTNIAANELIGGEGVYLQFSASTPSIDFKAASIDLGRADDEDLNDILFFKAASDRPVKVLFEADSDFRAEGVFYAPGDDIAFRVARPAGSPQFEFGMIARNSMLDIAKGSVLAIKPLVRVVDGEATLAKGEAIRLMR